jgi:hypothetical protein
VVHDVIVCQTENVDARGLDAVDAIVGRAEYRSRFGNGRSLLDERAFQIGNDQVRVC